MNIIFKYTLQANNNNLWLPEDATILDVQAQNGQLQMWVLQDNSHTVCERRFFVAMTGFNSAELDRPHVYVATVQLGALVFHVFEELRT